MAACLNIGSMTAGRDATNGKENATIVSVHNRTRARVFFELVVAYWLILIVCWTPRPWQKLLWWVAAATIVIFTIASFDGLKAMGLRPANFFRSLWVAGVALLLAMLAVLMAFQLHTLRVPGTAPLFIQTFWAYALWAAEQFLLQCFFLARLLRLIPNAKFAAFMAAVIFSLAHLPSPILTLVTLIWGLAACLVFLRYRNLYSLAISHAIFGITIAITIPGSVDHNMRVGRGYLTYGHTHKPPKLPQP
jgi:membrane protease YdiL (CAAX protease family)